MTLITLEESYGTLSETINGLIQLGYTFDFNIKSGGFVCHKTNTILSPADFQIDKVYRFEGPSDPDYQAILYAISSVKHELKGTLVNGYGISADQETSNIVEKLKTNEAIAAGPREVSMEATPQRPDGVRILKAPLVEMDLMAFIKQIKDEPTWSDSDRNSVTLFKSESLRVVLIGLRENAEMKPHKANGMITVQVLEGRMVFTSDELGKHLEKGQMIVLQENITHSVMALTDCIFLLTLATNR